MTAVQKTEDIFGTKHMNLCAWLKMLNLEANDVKRDDVGPGGGGVYII
jgi:hypothetical protein